MSNELAPRAENLPVIQLGNDVDDNDDLSSGVSGGFSVLSIKGSKWRVKHGGEETAITNEEGDSLPALKVLMLKANRHITKNYYASGYVEGASEAPDCYSTDGKKPDASVETPMSPTCAGCPMNVFGSRVTDTGSKAKACSDQRRVVVLPEGDYANELYGGPMLLRVPAASLSDLAVYGRQMKAKGFPYNSIITKLSFDSDAAYPKIKFQASRPLSQDEANTINGLIADGEFMAKVENILANPVEVTSDAAPTETAAAPEPEKSPFDFEDEAPPAAPAATAAPTPAPAAPVAEPDDDDGEADALQAAAAAAQEAADAAKKKAATKKAAATRAANKAKKQAETAAVAPAPTPTPPPAATAEATVSEGDELGDDLNNILASLEGLN